MAQRVWFLGVDRDLIEDSHLTIYIKVTQRTLSTSTSQHTTRKTTNSMHKDGWKVSPIQHNALRHPSLAELELRTANCELYRCMCAHVGACSGVYIHVYMHVKSCDQLQVPATSSFEAESLTCLSFTNLAKLAGPKDPHISASPVPASQAPPPHTPCFLTCILGIKIKSSCLCVKIIYWLNHLSRPWDL